MKRQSNRRDFIKRSALTAALLPVSPTIAAGETKARPFAQPQNFKKIKGRGTPDRIPKWNTDSTIIDSIMVEKMGNIGIGTPMPGEKIHLGDGNFLIEGGGETAIKIKRDFTITGKSGESPFPIFEFGRITQAGDGDPELVFFYSDDIIRSNPDMNKREVKILEVDRKGILASVKPVLEGKSRDDSTGSHFEGFIAKEVEPLFRLNSGPNPDQPGSGPRMRLEMGPGGSTPVDVAVQREAAATMTFRTGTAERVRIDGNGNV
ncbi:MAG TPA: twin-arginine translocation signal domain-containing protein, partial [Blastocatellia bacterium]